MQLGMIGLGRMGASMVRRLLRSGHTCVVHDTQPSAVAPLVEDGAAGAALLRELVSQLARPRAIWLMVPAAVVDQALGDLVPLLDTGDIVIDGGNSYYHDDLRRGTQLQALLEDRELPRYGGRVLSAMRYEFGGHVERPAS